MTVGSVTTFRSLYPDIKIPDIDIPTAYFELVRRYDKFARKDSPEPVLIDGSHSPSDKCQALTIDQVETLATSFGSALQTQYKLAHTDVVLILLPNTLHYTTFVLGVLMAGGICTLANPRLSARDLAHQLKDSQARFIVTESSGLEIINNALKSDAALKRQIPQSHILMTSSLLLDTTVDANFKRVQLATNASTTVALICYSSGTSGHPKGVLLSHKNIVSNIFQNTSADLQHSLNEPSPMSIAVLPMFHIYAFTALGLGSAVSGIPLVTVRAFSIDTFIDFVEKYQVTLAMLVPPIIAALTRIDSDDTRLDSLRIVTSGAAPLSPSLVKVFESRFPNVTVMQGYGVTESSPTLSRNTPTDIQAKSSGALVANVSVRVIDDDGVALGIGEVGELCFKGPNIMLGYLNNEQATREAIDDDGFLHTGDIGFIDNRRHVFVTDRKKELIKYKGFQVAPAELEAVLGSYPRIVDCAVTRVEKDGTEVPRAFVVVEGEEKLRVAYEAVEWVNQQVSYYKRIRGGVEVRDEIPRSVSGKTLRRLLQ